MTLSALGRGREPQSGGRVRCNRDSANSTAIKSPCLHFPLTAAHFLFPLNSAHDHAKKRPPFPAGEQRLISPLAALARTHGNGDRLRLRAFESLAEPVNEFAQSLHVPSVRQESDEKHTFQLTECSLLSVEYSQPSYQVYTRSFAGPCSLGCVV